MNTKPWTLKPWDVRTMLVLQSGPLFDIPFIDYRAPRPGKPGRPKGRKFGDSPRFKARKSKRH